MVSKDVINWSLLTEKHINECLSIINNYDLKQLELAEPIEKFLVNLSSNHNCDNKVLLYTILSGISHFSERINVYNMETKQVKPISVYEILIAPSGVEKSKYINIISNACTKVEKYIYNNYYRKQQVFTPAGVDPIAEIIEERNKNYGKTFENWINDHGSVKQVYTTPSLVQMMATTSIFFLANEGDAILQESSFYNPSDVSCDIKQGTLIDCWDGNKIIKSTITHGSREIKDRTVTICVATTGRRWPDLLRELAKIQIAGGLHERFNYFCFDITNTSTNNNLSPITEHIYYESLYDNLLCASRTENKTNYSLEQIFFVIKLFGQRTFIWSKQAFTYIQPRLDELKTNKQCHLISDKIVFQTKQQMALRRRSAEHIVRYACLLQMFFNSLCILNSMNDNVIESSAGKILEGFETEAKHQIMDLFGPQLERENSYYDNGVPIQPLQVDIKAATSAVALIFNLLLPQAVVLYNYEGVGENKLVNFVLNDVHMANTKEEKTILQIEKYIIQLKLKFFHKSCITDRHFRDKRSLVNNVLNDLVHRQLLYQAEDNKSFFESGRASTIKTYLKLVPTANDEARFTNALLNLYHIDFEDYKQNFEDAPLLPPNCKLTSYGMDFIRKPPYESIINRTNNKFANESVIGIPIGITQPIVNSQVSIDNNNNDIEREQSTSVLNNINENFSMNDLISLNQTRTAMESNMANNNLEIDLANSYKRRSLSSTTTDKPQQAKDGEFDAAFIQPNSNNSGQLFVIPNNNEETTINDPIIHVDDDSPSLLSSIHEEDSGAQAQKTMSKECTTESSEKTQTPSLLNDSDFMTHMMSQIKKKPFYGKILSIPSVLLTKGLISAHIKISPSEMKQTLNDLMEKQLLKSGKYLQCTKRKIEAYLKYVPENLEDRKVKYALQTKLLEFDVNVNVYIESLKTMQLITTSLRPSDLLINTLQEPAYLQLNIDLSIKHADTSVEKQIDEDEESSNDENLVGKVRRKKLKPSSENK